MPKLGFIKIRDNLRKSGKPLKQYVMNALREKYDKQLNQAAAKKEIPGLFANKTDRQRRELERRELGFDPKERKDFEQKINPTGAEPTAEELRQEKERMRLRNLRVNLERREEEGGSVNWREKAVKRGASIREKIFGAKPPRAVSAVNQVEQPPAFALGGGEHAASVSGNQGEEAVGLTGNQAEGAKDLTVKQGPTGFALSPKTEKSGPAAPSPKPTPGPRINPLGK